MKVIYRSAVLDVFGSEQVMCFCWTCRVVLIFVCVSSQTVVGGCPARSQREPCRRPRRRQQRPAHLTPRWPSRSRHSSSHTSRSTGRRNSTPWAELSGGEASLCIARQRLAGQQEQKLHYVMLGYTQIVRFHVLYLSLKKNTDQPHICTTSALNNTQI